MVFDSKKLRPYEAFKRPWEMKAKLSLLCWAGSSRTAIILYYKGAAPKKYYTENDGAWAWLSTSFHNVWIYFNSRRTCTFNSMNIRDGSTNKWRVSTNKEKRLLIRDVVYKGKEWCTLKPIHTSQSSRMEENNKKFLFSYELKFSFNTTHRILRGGSCHVNIVTAGYVL